MKGWTSMVVLAAVLIGVAGWWVDSRQGKGGEQGAEESAEGVTGVEDAHLREAGSQPEPGPGGANAHGAEGLERTPLPDTLIEGRLPDHEGPIVELPLNLSLRTTEFYRSPPCADMGLELRYERRTPGKEYGDFENGTVLARLRTDTDGQTSCLLQLPADEEGKVRPGYLYLRPTSAGFQDTVHTIGLSRYTRRALDRDLVFPMGTQVKVRAVGLERPQGPWGSTFPLTVERLDKATPPVRVHFEARGDTEGSQAVATLPLVEAGRYRLSARCREGVGVVKSIQLDPEHPPAEITILIEEYGTLSGKVELRHVPTQGRWRVRAVAEDVAALDRPPEEAVPDPKAFPPRVVDAPLDADDGRFRITGLAPGSYHLAFVSPYRGYETSGWFDHPPVPTGTQDLELDLEETVLELDLQPDLGQDGASSAAKPQVELRRLSRTERERSFRVHETHRDGKAVGFPLFPGNRYRLLVWSPNHVPVEKEFEAPEKGGTWNMRIPLVSQAPGTLTWSGPSREIAYEVLSPEYGMELERWAVAAWSDPEEQKLSLPPGRYRVRATGESEREGHHGNLLDSRTPYGVQEHWVEIRSGQTSHLEFDPPSTGWLRIDLDAVGQPDPGLTADSFPSLEGVTFGGYYQHSGQASFVMHDLTRGGSRALTFPDWSLITAQIEVTHLHPGSIGQPIEVFPPGKYELEVRVPGFPSQRQEVTIEPGSWTDVAVELQGVEE